MNKSTMLINTKNDDLIEWPEMAKNAMGGTEAMVRRIYERLPRELLKEVQIVPTRMSKPLDPKRIRISVGSRFGSRSGFYLSERWRSL